MPDSDTLTTDMSSQKQARIGRGRNFEFEAALGARIRAVRIAAKMSQGALGSALGISFQQVQKYELGKDRVAASTLAGIAAALGVHPGSFFDQDAPLQQHSVVEVRDSVKIGQRIQRVRDPGVVKRLLALADMLAGPEVGQAAADGDGAP